MKNLALTELVKKVADQDEEAFNELYRRYYKLVRYIAYGLTKSDADTDEIVQEVFIQVQKSIHDLNDPKLFKAWLSRITYSKAKMLFRKHRDHAMDEQCLEALNAQEEERVDFVPRRNQRHNHDLEVLFSCMQKLKPDFIEVLMFYYFSQMSIKEISEMLNTPEGTIKSRMLYAKKYLKHEILAYEEKTQESITFQGKTLEAALVTFGARMVMEPKVPLWNIFRNSSSTVTKTMLVGVVCVSAMVGVRAILNVQNNDTIADVQETQKQFQPVLYQGEWIDTPRKAYTVLIRWADCEVEMREKTKADFDEVMPVYRALTAFGEGYDDLLKKYGWDDHFEYYYAQI